MTSKVKAKKLVEKYRYRSTYEDMEEDIRMSESKAIQCALICVNAILSEVNSTTLRYEYWEEVKQEINKL